MPLQTQSRPRRSIVQDTASYRPDTLGEILHENWMLKKSLTDGISSGEIGHWYDAAINAGALGGKLLAAGSGGFLMFYAPVERHDYFVTLSKSR